MLHSRLKDTCEINDLEESKEAQMKIHITLHYNQSLYLWQSSVNNNVTSIMASAVHTHWTLGPRTILILLQKTAENKFKENLQIDGRNSPQPSFPHKGFPYLRVNDIIPQTQTQSINYHSVQYVHLQTDRHPQEQKHCIDPGTAHDHAWWHHYTASLCSLNVFTNNENQITRGQKVTMHLWNVQRQTTSLPALFDPFSFTLFFITFFSWNPD